MEYLRRTHKNLIFIINMFDSLYLIVSIILSKLCNLNIFDQLSSEIHYEEQGTIH